jgi:hypothetical protein
MFLGGFEKIRVGTEILRGGLPPPGSDTRIVRRGYFNVPPIHDPSERLYGPGQLRMP